MKLGTKSKYAIVALVDIASGNQEESVSLSEISEKQNLPLSYLEQIFLKLRRHNIVNSIRGSKGGYTLTRSPSLISVLDVIECVDRVEPSTRCLAVNSKFSCVKNGTHCLTHRLWRNLDNLMLSFLRNVTLKDICDQQFETLLFKVDKEDKTFVSDHMLQQFDLKNLEHKVSRA